MTFSNPIVAGEELIRASIKSENFVMGVSGWRIARDGDAEFNDLIVRGDFTVIGDTPPDEYLRIYQDLGTPTIEWSSESGYKWENYTNEGGAWPFLKITNSSNCGVFWLNGMSNLPNGAVVFSDNLGSRSVYYDPDDGFLKVSDGFNGTVNDEEDWTNLPLVNGWVADGETPQYKLMVDGTVVLKGNLTGGTTANGTVFGQLPAGYQPVSAHRFITAEKQTGVDYRHVRVSTNGDVDVWKCTTAHICIDGIRFPVI